MATIGIGAPRLIGCSGLLVWAAYECAVNEASGRDVWRDPNYAIFMFSGDLLLLLWMWGVSILVWRKCNIDFVRWLGLEKTTLAAMELPEQAVFHSATELSIVFLSVFIYFNLSVRGALGASSSSSVSASNGSNSSNSSEEGQEDQEGKNFSVAHLFPPLLVMYFLYRAFTPYTEKDKKLWVRYLYVLKQGGCCTHETDMPILSCSGVGYVQEFYLTHCVALRSHVRPLTTPPPLNHNHTSQLRSDLGPLLRSGIPGRICGRSTHIASACDHLPSLLVHVSYHDTYHYFHITSKPRP